MNEIIIIVIVINNNDNGKKIIRKVITGNRTIRGAVSTKQNSHTIIPKPFGFVFSSCLDPPLLSAQKTKLTAEKFSYYLISPVFLI